MATQLQIRYLYHFGCSNDRSYFQILPQNSHFVTQTDLFHLKSALNISESVVIKFNSHQHDMHRSTSDHTAQAALAIKHSGSVSAYEFSLQR